MRRNKRGLSAAIIVGLVLILLTGLVILYLFITGFFAGLGNATPFTPLETTSEVTNHCTLKCQDILLEDLDPEAYCQNKTKPVLNLGNKKKIVGSCAALEDFGSVGSFGGIPSCEHVTCGGYEGATCFDGSRKVECGVFRDTIDG